MRTPVGGGGWDTLTTGLSQIRRISVDATSVCWSTESHGIMKLTPK
jgi:hypothetical protein